MPLQTACERHCGGFSALLTSGVNLLLSRCSGPLSAKQAMFAWTGRRVLSSETP